VLKAIDEQCAFLQALEEGRVDQPPGFLRKREVDADRVGGFSEFGKRGAIADIERLGLGGRETARPADDVHVERECPPRDRAADAAQADDPEGSPLESARLAEFLLAPLPGAQVDQRFGDAAVGGDPESDRQLCDGVRVLAGAVGHVDASFAGLPDVDRIDAGACTDDQRERHAGFNGGSGHLLGTDDQDINARHFAGERLGGNIGLLQYLATQRQQIGSHFRGNLVGDQNLHGDSSCCSIECQVSGRSRSPVRVRSETKISTTVVL
jgi:hypothetical protein